MKSERGLPPEPQRTWPRKRGNVTCSEGGCTHKSRHASIPGACRIRFFRGTATAWPNDTTLDSPLRAKRMQSPTWPRLANYSIAPATCRGYSLLEMLVYIAVFAIGVNLFVSLLGTGSRLAAATSLSMSRMEGVREVQEEFMQYTRRAAAVVPEAGEFKTGPDRLVLKMPPGQENGFDYAVLGVLREANHFAVMGLAAREGGLEVVYLKTLRQPLETLVFDVDGAGVRPLVNLRLKVQGEEGERKQPFVEHRASATPRGVGG